MKERKMPDEMDATALHRKFAVDCFNGTWDLLDKPDRSPEDDANMIHMTHASRYHWGQIGTPLEFSRGDWQISRVYAVLRMGDLAFRYAKSALDLCHEHGYGDFDLAFAYEALARACAVIGDLSRRDEYLLLANEAGHAIAEADDRKHFFNELKTIST
jgi:hypothetical protein